MDRNVRTQLNTQIYEEACEWFIEFRGGEIDGTQRRELDQWLRKSPEHLRAYLEIAAIWNEGPTLDPDCKWDADKLVSQAAQEVDNVFTHPTHSRALGDPVPTRSRRTASRRIMAIAASMLLAVLGVWFYVQRNVYATDIGEQRSIRLSDGSTVDLNSRTRVEVRYSDHERTVQLLEGQALFQVAKETARPFVVKTDATRVRAIGTQFDVNRRKADTIVTVLEGRVAVVPSWRGRSPARPEPSNAAPSLMDDHEGSDVAPKHSGSASNTSVGRVEEAIYLSAGEQLSVQGGAPHQPIAANLASATAWRQRQLVFESATLAEVAEEFNRYNERQLVIEDAELYDFHISGVFSSDKPGSLLQFLRTRPGVRVTETDADFRIAKKPSR